MEGRRLGRAPLDVDHAGLIRDRLAGMSLSAVARIVKVERRPIRSERYRSIVTHAVERRDRLRLSRSHPRSKREVLILHDVLSI